MPAIVLDVPLKMYKKIEKIALERTITEAKFISMTDILLPVLEKEFT